MLRYAVTAIGLAGWLGAIVIVTALRSSVRPDAVILDGADGVGPRFGKLVARGAGSMAGCVTAGVLVMGLGGRLMMRLLAASSSDEVQGAITDMDAVVGEITVGGTVGFIAFVGTAAGLIGWIIRLGTRRWLPRASVSAGLVGAAIGAGALARPSSLLDPDNHDFELLTPDWLSVALILGLIVTLGVAVAVFGDWMADRWPAPGSGWSALWAAPFLALIFAPPVLVVLGVGAAFRMRISDPNASPLIRSTDRVGRIIVAVAATLGGLWTVLAAVDILTA